MKDFRKKKALILSTLASLAILSGCSSESKEESKTITVNGEQYVQNGDEYIKIDVSPRTFEPGTHVIHYIDIPNKSDNTLSNKYIKKGFDNAAFSIGDLPDGYKLVGVTDYSTYSGYSYYIIYILVNEKTVIAEGRYDEFTQEVVYETPGKIVEEEALTLEP